jgi:hypothetical protein
LPAGLVEALGKLGHDVDSVPQEALTGQPHAKVWDAGQNAQRFLKIWTSPMCGGLRPEHIKESSRRLTKLLPICYYGLRQSCLRYTRTLSSMDSGRSSARVCANVQVG